PQDWYPWEAKDIKECCKAVAEDRANSPWAQTLLQDIAYNPCVPKDWLDMAKAILSSTHYIKWCAHYNEECRVQVEANQAPNPAMLVGTAEGYSTGVQQAAVPGPYRDQVRQAGLVAWAKLDEGPTESPIVRVRQRPNESLPEFIDKVQQSINCELPPGTLQDQFMKILVWDGVNSEHCAACTGLKEAFVSGWMVTTQDFGTQQHQTQMLTMALQSQTATLTESLSQVLAVLGQGATQPIAWGVL
ncbi:hypothetical protein A6R68_24269, partial [Neotoma lepida]